MVSCARCMHAVLNRSKFVVDACMCMHACMYLIGKTDQICVEYIRSLLRYLVQYTSMLHII